MIRRFLQRIGLKRRRYPPLTSKGAAEFVMKIKRDLRESREANSGATADSRDVDIRQAIADNDWGRLADLIKGGVTREQLVAILEEVYRAGGSADQP